MACCSARFRSICAASSAAFFALRSACAAASRSALVCGFAGASGATGTGAAGVANAAGAFADTLCEPGLTGRAAWGTIASGAIVIGLVKAGGGAGILCSDGSRNGCMNPADSA
jgi:hypothetical protein